MSTLRDEIFNDIRSDYNREGANSFLYKYLRNGKLKDKCDKNPEKEKMLIHKAATDLMYNLGYALAKKKRSVPEEPEYAFMVQGLSAAEEKRRLKSINPAKMAEENKQKKNRQEKKKEEEEKAEERSRTRNTALDLIDAWYSRRGYISSSIFQRVAPDEDYQKLFVVLNDSGATGAFVPVRIDTMTGAGLFILGRDYYPPSKFPFNRNYSCGFCIISRWNLDEEEKEGASLECDPKSWDVGKCDNVAEAIKNFEVEIQNGRQDYLCDIQEYNGRKPPDCPPNLELYFYDYETEDDFEQITDEDIHRSKDDFGRIVETGFP